MNLRVLEFFDDTSLIVRGLVTHDDVAMIQRGIAALDEEQAQVLLLRDIDGLSYQEIAAVLDLPLGSVKSKIHRARLALKDHLARTSPAANLEVERRA